MKDHKVSDARSASKQHQITPGRVSHSPAQTEVRDAKEGARSGHKDSKDK